MSALPLAVPCLFYVLFDQINKAAYRSGGWDQFYEYNTEKTSMIDLKYLTYNGASKNIFERVGWSENDYKMFCFWGFVDETTYSIEKLYPASLTETFPLPA